MINCSKIYKMVIGYITFVFHASSWRNHRERRVSGANDATWTEGEVQEHHRRTDLFKTGRTEAAGTRCSKKAGDGKDNRIRSVVMLMCASDLYLAQLFHCWWMSVAYARTVWKWRDIQDLKKKGFIEMLSTLSVHIFLHYSSLIAEFRKITGPHLYVLRKWWRANSSAFLSAGFWCLWHCFLH